MSLKIHTHGFSLAPQLHQILEKKAVKLERILPTFAGFDLSLNATVEKLSHTHQFHVILVLTLPQHSLRAEDVGPTVASCILRAFDELVRRLKRFKSQLNGQQFRHRRTPPVVSSGPSDEADVVLAVSQSLDRIENYVRRELFHQVLAASIPPGLIQTEAVLDEVFLEARDRFSRRPTDYSLEQWLIGLAREKIQNRLLKLEAERDHPHVEERAHIQERWYDEALTFYQPDEALCVEDLLPDAHSETPEALLARHEREESLRQAIAQLPGEIRESFVLFALEGFNSDEVAMITRKPPARVLEEVQEARNLLRRVASA